jgi:hypothetical protein
MQDTHGDDQTVERCKAECDPTDDRSTNAPMVKAPMSPAAKKAYTWTSNWLVLPLYPFQSSIQCSLKKVRTVEPSEALAKASKNRSQDMARNC